MIAPGNGSRPTLNAAMLPPPDPAPPQAILEPEMTALTTCLRNSAVKTGQVYQFYADLHKLKMDKVGVHPPRSLTSALGREVEKYDQLCDAMETHINRAIAVLQRDLRREEERLKAEAAAAAAAAAAKLPTPILDPSGPLTSSPPASPTQSIGASTDLSAPDTQKPPLPTPARRQSTVSLSSLQRQPFPHKLDLSPTSLHAHPDDVLQSGLSSPVTLAPRSSHRSFPQELGMVALSDAANRSVDIDLTVGDTEMDMSLNIPDLQQAQAAVAGGSVDPSIGSSADKPIELDLDMDMDMFKASANAAMGEHSNPFFDGSAASVATNNQVSNGKTKQEETFFNHMGAPSGHSGDLFGPFGSSLQASPLGSHAGPQHLHPPLLDAAHTAPSPGSILASFSDPQHGNVDMSSIDFSSLGSGFFDEHGGGSSISAEVDRFLNLTGGDGAKDGKT